LEVPKKQPCFGLIFKGLNLQELLNNQNFQQMRQTFLTFSALLAAFLFSAFVQQKQEVGKAGYYADSLHGRKTASGEKYDKYEFTCAHKTLAFGTKVRVTRLDNKKSVVVRVNDRGPFVEGYVTDLSRAAAEALDMIKIGITQVKLEIVEAGSTARVAADTDGSTAAFARRGDAKATTLITKPAQYSTDPTPVSSKVAVAEQNQKLPSELFAVDIKQTRKEGYGVQVSTLYDADNVIPILKKVQQEWPAKALVSVTNDEKYKKKTYRVIIGPFADKKSAELQQKAAAKKGYKGCFVVELGGM